MADTLYILRNMIAAFARNFGQAWTLQPESIDKLGNTETAAGNQIIRTTANTSDEGLIVSSDDTAPNREDFTLSNQITEGVGAGQLTHGATSVTTVILAGDTLRSALQISRPFTNNSAGAITIKKVGILFSRGAGATDAYLCLVVVLQTPITLNPTDVKTITVKVPTTL